MNVRIGSWPALASLALGTALTFTGCAAETQGEQLETPQTAAARVRPGRANWGVVLGAIRDRASAGPVNINDRSDAIACDIDQLGMGWTRVDVGLGDGDLTPFQRFITASHARGLRVLVLVHPGNFATGSVDVNRPGPDIQAWVDRYVARVNTLIDTTFTGDHRADAYEIGNEPNGGQSDINAGAFAVLLDRVWLHVRNVSHAEGSPAFVSGGPLGAWIGQPWWQSFLYHLQLLRTAGHTMPFDAFAVHPYNGDVYRNEGAQRWSDTVRSNLGDLVTNLNRIYGFRPRIWVTEIGWGSSRTLSNGAPAHEYASVAADEAEQAALFERADDTFAGIVENAFWYVYRDDELVPGSEYFRMGVRASSGGNYAVKTVFARMAARLGGAGNATSCYQTAPPPPPPPPPGGGGGSSGSLTFDRSDARRTTRSGDWQYGSYKSECGDAQAVTGLSMSVSDGAAHSALCSVDEPSRHPHTACRAVNFETGDNRGTTSTGDWDSGFFKGECGSDEYVAGIAQTPGHRVTSILCCRGAVAHAACATRRMDGGDARESGSAPGDWDSGYWKGECGSGRYVAGISRDIVDGSPHAILCCSAR